MSMLSSLSDDRVFRVFTPDVSLADAQRNEPYALRITVPAGSQFLGVPQIASPMAGMGMLAGTPQVAYAFLCNPAVEELRNVYVTAVFSERAFPWHVVAASASEIRTVAGGGTELEYSQEVFCTPIGITSHNGVPLLHVRVDVHWADYDRFESELVSAGYRVIPSKPYAQAESLIELYRAHAKATTSPPNEGEVGS